MKKVTQENIKKHARKLRNASDEQFGEIQEGYSKLMEGVRGMDIPGLLLLSFIGIVIILLFRGSLFDVIGLLIFGYSFYLFAQKTGHHEGYCEGYYDNMTKEGTMHAGRDEK